MFVCLISNTRRPASYRWLPAKLCSTTLNSLKGKTATLHVHQACTTTTWNCLVSHFLWRTLTTDDEISFLFINLDTGPGVRLQKTCWNNLDRVWKNRIHFLSDVFVAWPSSTWYLKLPILLLMVATLVWWLLLVTYTRTYVHNPRDTRYILWTTLACEEDVPHDRSLGTKRSAPLPLDD